jgi:hypothetical protein
MKTVEEVRSELSVAAEVDVLVCGGGPAGFAAALAAARTGAKTLLIEQCNCMGGIATAGGHNHLCLYSSWRKPEELVVGGIPFEMMHRVVEMGLGAWEHDPSKRRGCAIDFELDALKLSLEQLAGEAGVGLLYHTQFADAIMDGGKLIGAAVQNKSGRLAILAKQIVDATGDADVAASAGAPWEMGRPEDGACQPATLMFTIGGVDWGRFTAGRNKHKTHLEDVWKTAQEAGDMEPFQSRIMGFWWTPTRPDQVGVNFTHITEVDCTDASSVTAATIEGRRQAFHMIPVFRKYVEGFEDCYMISTASLLGTRESRRIVGEHMLRDVEIVDQCTFDDSICYGSFYIDVHNCTGPGMDTETYYPPVGFKYQIPYRCIVPKETDNLLVAGRCISVDHRALGSTRVMPQCAALGQAAGTAAALSAQRDCRPRDLDVRELQAKLREDGAVFDEQGVEKLNAQAAEEPARQWSFSSEVAPDRRPR